MTYHHSFSLSPAESLVAAAQLPEYLCSWSFKLYDRVMRSSHHDDAADGLGLWLPWCQGL